MEQHPDLRESVLSGAALQRNKTERKRLQGLQKAVLKTWKPPEPKTLKERFNVWLINEGGKKLFFGTWIILHLLVAAFGFVNYHWKDDMENARAKFGYTFSSQFNSTPSFIQSEYLVFSHCEDSSACTSRGRSLHSPPCLPQLHIPPSTDPSQWRHSVR